MLGGRGALGLRGRIVGALLVTTVATLGVEALALLGPLENGLRSAAVKSLQNEVKDAITPFKRLQLAHVLDAPDPSAPATDNPYADVGTAQQAALTQQQQLLGTRFGATVTLLGYPDVSGHAQPLATPENDGVQSDSYDDAAAAFLTHRTKESFGSIDGTDVARVAIPLTIAGQAHV